MGENAISKVYVPRLSGDHDQRTSMQITPFIYPVIALSGRLLRKQHLTLFIYPFCIEVITRNLKVKQIGHFSRQTIPLPPFPVPNLSTPADALSDQRTLSRTCV